MTRKLDLVDLNLFVHIVEAASVTGGAARAHLSVTAASERLCAMEASLGVALLERGRDRFRVLPAGDALVRHARIVLARMADLRDALAFYAEAPQGTVRLLSNTSALSEFLPEVLPRFLASHPGIELEVQERPSDEIARDVSGGAWDIGLLSDKADLACLQAIPLRADPLALIVPANDPLAARAEIAFAEVDDRNFVGLSPAVAFQQYVERCARRANRPLRVRLRAHSFEQVCRYVERGLGYGVLPLVTAARWTRTIGVRAIRLKEPWAQRSLSVCIRDAAALSRPARRLLEHLTAEARNVN